MVGEHLAVISVRDLGKYLSFTEQGCIHGSISRERWAGALMEVRSIFALNSALKKTRDGTTDGTTEGQTLI